MPSHVDWNIVTNGGAMTILAYMAIYLIPRWMDKTGVAFANLVLTFREEQRYEREMCTEQFKEIMSVLRSNQENVAKTLEAVQKQIEEHQRFSELAVNKLTGKGQGK